MRWWDTSAFVALLAKQHETAALRGLHAADDGVIVWWGTQVESVSALARLERGGALRASQAARLAATLESHLADADEIRPSEEIRTAACRVARSYHLTAGDALQLAAALVWTEHQPNGAGFVCLDRRLREAAAREGFEVLPREEVVAGA